MLKLNKTDLLLLAEKVCGTVLSPATDPEEILRVIAEQEKREPENPTRELRATMCEWVEKHYHQIRAQADCSLDCIICPLAHVTACFLYNRQSLAHDGLLPTEDPWLRS